MADDIKKIKDLIKLSEVIGAHVKLTHDGQEYRACCPFHNEKTPSFTVVDSKQYYHCFGCGAHGDIIDWCEQALRMDKREAIDYCKALAGLGDYKGNQPVLKVEPVVELKDSDMESDDWQAIIPVPDDAPDAFSPDKIRTVPLWNAKRGKEITYYPKLIHPFRTAEGALIGYVVRIEIDGKKLTPQITFAEHKTTKERRWCVLHIPAPRPLYGLDLLAARPKAPVVVVEGEKSADAARDLLPSAVVITWPGGTKGISKVEWEPLKGRNVVMWPDADMPGEQAAWGYMKRDTLMPGLHQKIGTGCRLVIIDPPEGKADGWDAADAKAEGWDAKTTGEWLTKAVMAAQKRGHKPPVADPNYQAPQPPKRDEAPPQAYDGPDYSQEIPSTGYDGPLDYDAHLKAPYTALGHYRGLFYYLPNRSKQVIELQAIQHRELNMMQLAPLDYWEATFPSRGGQTKVDWKLAADACMRACYERGFFDPKTKLRGRGAWIDEGRSVLHLGETLIVDGVKMPPHIMRSRYTYQADHTVEVGEAPPLDTKQANKLVGICRSLSWDNQRSGLLLAGWCVIAPVCGILSWRPHIWITGGAGTGKSTIIEHIIKPVVGPIALNVASTTSESGIRQELGSDARPVIFDEAESEDKAQSQRMQQILDLCRAASAESGAKIIKGTAGHDSKSFQIRSCFAFSSINTAVKHYADETRVTMLVLRSHNTDTATDLDRELSEKKFQDLKGTIITTMTPDYCAGLLMRTLELLPTLRANIDTFASAASVVLGSRRAADQLAPMIAGAYLLHSSKKITHDEAVNWLRANDMREATVIAHTQDDEARLLQFLMGHRLRVQTTISVMDRTVGELIETSYRQDANICSVAPDTAEAELNRFGIRTDRDGGFYVSTTSNEIKRALADTPWHSNWGRPLRMLKDASAPRDPVRFFPGNRSRAVYLPIYYVTNERD